MSKEDFMKEYEDEIEELRTQMRLSVIALEILYEELEKSNLPANLKLAILENYKMEK